MYTVPSYVTYRTEEDAIYITSELYRNTVRLTDHGLQKEFINLTRCGGCAELNTPLTRYLHEQELLVTEEELDHALHQERQFASIENQNVCNQLTNTKRYVYSSSGVLQFESERAKHTIHCS